MVDPRIIRTVGTNRVHEEASLIESVGRIGVINPVTVYIDDNGDFVLVAGHRRVSSAIHFGLAKIPIKVIPKNQADEVRALENIDRKALSPLDESVEVDKLLKRGYSRSDVSAMMGISEARVSRRVRLGHLTEKARGSLASGKVSLRVAEELAVMDSKLQDEIIDKGYGFSTPEAVRNFCWSRQGFPLDGCSDRFLETKGAKGFACSECPDNPHSNEELFGDVEGNGVCCNLECWKGKIRALFGSGDYSGVVFRYGVPDELSDLGATVPVVREHTDGHGCFLSGYDNGPLYLSIRGYEVRDSKDQITSNVSDDETILKELSSEYSTLRESSLSLLTSYRIAVRKAFEKNFNIGADNPLFEILMELASDVHRHSSALRDWTTCTAIADMTPLESISSAIAYLRTKDILPAPMPTFIPFWKDAGEFQRGEFKQLATKLGVKSPTKAEKALDEALDRLQDCFQRFKEVKKGL